MHLQHLHCTSCRGVEDLYFLCVNHAGSDPTKLIEDLAKRKKIKTLGVSMGQGQEVIARKLMATAAAEGQWLLLQNTHLGLNYLTEVEQYLSKAEDLHEDFRCAWQGSAAVPPAVSRCAACAPAVIPPALPVDPGLDP